MWTRRISDSANQLAECNSATKAIAALGARFPPADPHRYRTYVEALWTKQSPSIRWPLTCFRLSVMLQGLIANYERYMDLLSSRQKLVASNIANADTPGYQTQDIDFQFEFMSMVNGQLPQTVQVPDLQSKPDGNNVNVDREARMLAENALRFNVASTLLRSKLHTVQEAIQGGSGS